MPPSYQFAIALSPDEQSCVTISHEGDPTIRNLADESTVKLPLDILEAFGAAFSPGGKILAAASAMGYARLWDAKTWKAVATLRGFILGVQSVTFSPDGTCLATSGGSGTQALKLWDTESWQDVITLQGSSDLFYEPAFSPDGNSIGALSAAGILHVWRAPSWAEIHAAEAKEKTEAQQP